MKKILLPLLIFILTATALAQTSPPERRDYKTMIAQENTPPTPLPFQIKSRTGTGLNDFKTGRAYNQTVMATFVFTISHVFDPDFPDQPDQFDWSEVGGSGDTSGSAVDITGVSQAIHDGFTVTFLATAGHTLNNTWTVKVFPVNNMYWDATAGTMKARWSNSTTTSIGAADPPTFKSLTIQDLTPTTGSTKVFIKEGEGQGFDFPFAIYGSDGTTLLFGVHSGGSGQNVSAREIGDASGSTHFILGTARGLELADVGIATSQTTKPTVATAGTSASIADGSTDSDGTVSIVGTAFTGTTTITFNLTHTAAPKSVTLTPINATADSIAVPYVSSVSTTAWIMNTTGLTGTAPYYYHVSF